MVTKKDPKYDLKKFRGLLFNVGLVISIGLVLMAFEWKTPMESSTVDLGETVMESTLIDVPPTEMLPPPKPKVEPVVIKPVDDEEVVEAIDINIDIETNEDDVVSGIIFTEPEEEEKADDPFMLVEQMPTFMGGEKVRFLQYVGKHLKYPDQARRLNIEGKVFVQFVIDKDGSMSDIKVLRGIGAGCDKEVLRVLQNAPAWEPGKQRGVPVRVKMIVPVAFKLN